MKAMIATGVGVLALGGLLVANSGRSASAQSSLAGPGFVGQTDGSRTTLVNCGEGRQALISSDPRTGQSQVQCVIADASGLGNGFASGTMPGVATGLPVSQFAPTIVPAVQYAPAPATVRRTSAPAARRVSTSPTYRRASELYAAQPRSWKKSAIIIGGSTAGGAGVGAILGGKSGAIKGGVVGLLGGTIYDIATRNKH
jgi:hypothetical protein